MHQGNHSTGYRRAVIVACAGVLLSPVIGIGSPRTPVAAEEDTCHVPGSHEIQTGSGEDCNGNGTCDALDLVATFLGLGDLPGGNVLSKAYAVSADGSVVVGAGTSAAGREAFLWTGGDGMVGLGYLPGSTNGSEASSVSGDGAVVVGTSGPEAFRWTAGTGMVGLGHLQGFHSTSPAISADGSTIVGGDCTFSYYFPSSCEAFRWTAENGMIGLGLLPGGVLETVATGVSADGSVVVGYGDWDQSPCDCAGLQCYFDEPFRWTAGAGLMELNDLPVFCNRRASDVSADGSIAVGTADYYTFLWSEAGEPLILGDPAGGYLISSATGVSGDGSVLVGATTFSSGEEAFIWDRQNGMRSLREVLASQNGPDLTGWTLTTARDISRDGRTIVGWGINPDGFTEAWIATLPSADCNANGIPDECDIGGGTSRDCNLDDIADECQPELDPDGDGFLDACDACPQSNRETTLVVGVCDTRIANDVDAEGCTLTDLLSSACPLPTVEGSHGDFTACITSLADDWRHAGRISSRDVGPLVLCAARQPAAMGRENHRDR